MYYRVVWPKLDIPSHWLTIDLPIEIPETQAPYSLFPYDWFLCVYRDGADYEQNIISAILIIELIL